MTVFFVQLYYSSQVGTEVFKSSLKLSQLAFFRTPMTYSDIDVDKIANDVETWKSKRFKSS